MISIDFFTSPFFYFVDPSKRIYSVYFLVALVIGFLVFLKEGRGARGSLSSLFNLRVWQHHSSRLDLQLLFFNSFLRSILFVFVVLSSTEVAKSVARLLNDIFPHSLVLSLTYSQTMILYAIISFLALDFSRFFQHYLFHKIPWLWQFHKVHHSAQVLTPITLYRSHPVESILSSLRRIIVIGLVTGTFFFMTRSVITGYAILGVNVFDFLFNIFGSNLRHSHIWLSFGRLNYLFISPAQHQIHHSRNPKHYDKNLGFALSCWDQMFGTFYQVKEKEFLIFGLRGETYKGFWGCLKAPFPQIFSDLKKKL